MCEFLIKASEHWLEDSTPGERNKWPQRKKDSYERCIRSGDPVVVRPDGWNWSPAEAPPDFIVARVIGMSVADGEAYLDALDEVVGTHDLGDGVIETETKRRRRRKYAVPKTWISTIINVHGGFIEITEQQFYDQVYEKLL
jgi:hypothetical protein